jgi:outer membrane usher protein FimD/PapC
VFASQPITGPSGIIHPVEGLEIDVKKSNVVVGRLDGKSPLIVPRLSPLRSNKFEVDIADLPEEYSLEETTLNITPPRRGMVPIRFAVTKSNPKTFVVAMPDGTYPPAGSILTVEETNEQVVVSFDGETYFPDFIVPATFVLVTGDQVCSKSVEPPDRGLEVGSLEKIILTCQVRDR